MIRPLLGILSIPLLAHAALIEGEIEAPVQAEASIAAAWVDLPGADLGRFSVTVWPGSPGEGAPLPSRLQPTQKGHQILWRVPKRNGDEPLGSARRFGFRLTDQAGSDPAALSGTSANLVGNGSFTELDARGVPVGIQNFAKFKLVKSEDGNAIAFDKSSNARWVSYNSPAFAVSASESYRITFRYRMDGAKPPPATERSGRPTAHAILQFFDADEKRIPAKKPFFQAYDTNTDGWKTFELIVTPPPRAASALVQFNSGSEVPHSVLLSDLRVTPLLLGSARPAAAGESLPSVFRFNFGPGGAAAWHGFVPATTGAKYRPKKGWGFTRLDAPRAINNLRPDPLARDFITAAPANFRVDLPNGKYLVWFLAGDKSGGERYQRFYFDQFLGVNGKVLHQLNPKPSRHIMEQVLQNYDDFWVPGMDYYETFIRPGFTEIRGEVEVSDGRLNVEWRNLPVSAMMLYPAEAAGEMDREIAKVALARWRDTSITEVPAPRENPPIEPTAEERQRGFVLYRQPTDKPIYPTTSPAAGERIAALEAFATPGETEAAWFSLHALRDLGPVSIRVGDLRAEAGRIPASALEVRVARYLFGDALESPTSAAFQYQIAAAPLEKRDDLPLVQGHNWSWRIDLGIPEATPPGVYRGEVKIVTAKGELATLPLQVRVLPFRLEPLPIVQGYYYSPLEPWRAYFREVGSSVIGARAADDPDLLGVVIASEQREFEFMKSIGLNSAAFSYDMNQDLVYRDGGVFLKRDEEGFRNGFSLWMDLYAQAGMGPMPLYILQGIGRVGRGPSDGQKNRLSRLDPSLQPAFTEHWFNAYRSLVLNIQKEAEMRKWPEILWYISDEVKGGQPGVELSAKAGDALAGLPGVRRIASVNGPQERQLIPHVDIMMPNFAYPITEESVEELRKSNTEFWIYNCGKQRLTLGLWPWRMGAKGRFQWFYRYPAAEPWDGPGGGAQLSLSFPGPEGPIPTHYSDIVRAAIADHRYMATLEKLVARHKDDPAFARQVKAAEDFMNDLRKQLPVDIRELIGWRVDPADTGGALGGEYRNNDALQRLRWTIASLILDFQP